MIKPRKSKAESIADYLRKFAGKFPCGEDAGFENANVVATIATGRGGNTYWRIRCRNCYLSGAANAMARLRERRRMESA